ncbi:MAG TPA: nucleotide exchange factor GrpE [Bacteroidales bacterium]
MKKKKMKEQEEILRRNQNKTTDNKENTDSSENSNVEDADFDASGDSIINESENGNRTGQITDINDSYVKVVEGKLAEMQDKYVRLSAEFDNYRKRTLREKMDLSKYAGENLLLNILPIMDDFERALQHMDSSDSASIKDGILLIYGKLSEFLKQNYVKEIESMNCNFNVDLHEAVAKVPVEQGDKKGKVVDVVLKGYYLQDKVLRFSKVVVGE